MTTDLFAPAIRKEHFRAELQRLNEGWPGCGCADCQELYKTLDHSKYGTRVVYMDDIVIITEDARLHKDVTPKTPVEAATKIETVSLANLNYGTGPGRARATSNGRKRGRPARTDLDAEISQLAHKQLSSRAIAEQLELRGIQTSARTVARKLKRLTE